MPEGRRHMAVIGLYFALWEVSAYLEVIAADAFSCTQLEFQVPSSGIPVLWELLNNKRLDRKQSIVSLPPEYFN